MYFLLGSEGDDEDDIFERKYLAAAMDLDPGFFDCECVWKERFIFHPRLKSGTTTRGSTMSRGSDQSVECLFKISYV